MNTSYLLARVILCGAVAHACESATGAPFRIEAENGEMLPDAKGGAARPYDKIAGVSGGKILAFFSHGRCVRYGKVPAAKSSGRARTVPADSYSPHWP